MVGILRRIRARTLAVLRAVSAVTIGGVTASHRPIRARSNCWGVKCGRWSGSGLVLAGALAAGGLSGSALAVAPRESRAPISLIWDDDCGSDLDCVYSLEALHRQIDRKIVSVRALILDSPNPFGAPVLRAWNELWHHSLPIGAYRGSTGAKGADSGWSRAVRGALRPDDLSARYPDCVSVYRQALAGAPQHSVRIVETGFPTCLVALMKSLPDAISPLSGRDLIRSKVEALFVMGGDYPGPAGEYNFQSSAAESGELFSGWTKGNGYPPIYLTGFTPGVSVVPKLAEGSSTDAAVRLAETTAGETARPAWDLMSLHQAIAGMNSYVTSTDGTNRVSAEDGQNVWSADMGSGHFYLTAGKAGVDYKAMLEAFLNPRP